MASDEPLKVKQKKQQKCNLPSIWMYDSGEDQAEGAFKEVSKWYEGGANTGHLEASLVQ